MSIKIMSMVWESPSFDPYERLVMLSLADHCDDQGSCYPSIRRLCERTGMKERGVQNVIKRLSDRGHIEVELNAGRAGSNRYIVRATPAPDAPPHDTHPRTGCATPPHPTTQTPAPDAPKPSVTVIEPSGERDADVPAPKGDDVLVLEALTTYASEEAAKSFIAYRRKHKAKGLTPRAAARLSSTLSKLAQTGSDPDDALAMAEERGWASVELDWYLNAKGNAHDNRNGHQGGRGHPLSAGPASGSHAQSDRIADYARSRAARRAAGGGN